jgi:hypothetical protein
MTDTAPPAPVTIDAAPRGPVTTAPAPSDPAASDRVIGA